VRRLQVDESLYSQLPPPGHPLHVFTNTWSTDHAFRVGGWRINGGVVGWFLDRGADFEKDWVRYIWVLIDESGFDPIQGFKSLKAFLLAHHTRFVKWVLPAQHDVQWQEFFEKVGATPIEWDAQDWVTYGLDLLTPCRPYLTPSGFAIAYPRVKDLPVLRAWLSDDNLLRALSLQAWRKGVDLRSVIYTPESLLAGCTSAHALVVLRKDDKNVGFAIEYSWDLPNDTFREYDIALPGLKTVSVRTVPGLYGSLIDRAFRMGATRAMTASRSGVGGAGHPKIFRALGGDDVSQSVLCFGQGDMNRRYYATSPREFYMSRIGRRFTKHNPYPKSRPCLP
jgi:hypothetical protein